MGGDRPYRDAVKIRALAHPGRTWAFLVLCVAVAALAFGLGTLVRSPDAAVLEARDQAIPVYAKVDLRAVSSNVRIQGEIAGGEIHPVYAEVPEGTARAVVTALGVESGQTLTNGAFLGTVSDRPVFAFWLNVPLYRDIHAGDSGSDVSALQNALGVPVTGTLDQQTLQSVQELYADAEITPPRDADRAVFVRLVEFASLPPLNEPPVIHQIAGVGTVLEPEAAFAELSVGSNFVNVRASVREAEHITVGDEASVQGSGEDAEIGTVVAVGEYRAQPDETGRPPGRDIRVDLPEDSTLRAGQSAAVLFGSITEPTIAVPTLAVRSDATGTYMLRRMANGGEERVPITVLRNSDGWTAVDSDDLSVGDEVSVSS